MWLVRDSASNLVTIILLCKYCNKKCLSYHLVMKRSSKVMIMKLRSTSSSPSYQNIEKKKNWTPLYWSIIYGTVFVNSFFYSIQCVLKSSGLWLLFCLRGGGSVFDGELFFNMFSLEELLSKTWNQLHKRCGFVTENSIIFNSRADRLGAA